MAVYAADQTRHHSASRASLHDEMSASKSAPPKTEKSAMPSGASKDVSHMDIKEVVAKHGPAHEVHVKHDHEAGAHHVTSHHDGVHHKSTHGSAKEAHEHGMMAAGHEMEDEEHEPTETPDDEMSEQNEGSIPGLS